MTRLAWCLTLLALWGVFVLLVPDSWVHVAGMLAVGYVIGDLAKELAA